MSDDHDNYNAGRQSKMPSAHYPTGTPAWRGAMDRDEVLSGRSPTYGPYTTLSGGMCLLLVLVLGPWYLIEHPEAIPYLARTLYPVTRPGLVRALTTGLTQKDGTPRSLSLSYTKGQNYCAVELKQADGGKAIVGLNFGTGIGYAPADSFMKVPTGSNDGCDTATKPAAKRK